MSTTDRRSITAPAAWAWVLPHLIGRLAPLLLLALAACMPGNENSVIDRSLANDARMPGLWVGRLGDDDVVVAADHGRNAGNPAGRYRHLCRRMPGSPTTAPRGRGSAGGTSWSSPRPTPPAGPGPARRWTWASVSSSPTRSTATDRLSVNLQNDLNDAAGESGGAGRAGRAQRRSGRQHADPRDRADARRCATSSPRPRTSSARRRSFSRRCRCRRSSAGGGTGDAVQDSFFFPPPLRGRVRVGGVLARRQHAGAVPFTPT